MTGREFLNKGLVANARISALKEQICNLREEMVHVRAVTLKEEKGRTPRDLMSGRVATICDKIVERERQIMHWENIKKEVETAIDNMTGLLSYKVIYAKFIRGATVCEIALELRYSRSYVYSLINQGVKEVEEFMRQDSSMSK